MSSPVWLVQPRVVSWPRTSILLLLLLSSITFALQPTAAQAQSNTCNSYPSPHQRMGVNVTLDGGVALSNYDAARLSAGWYHDYNRQLTPSHPNGMQYHQMIRSGINTTTLAQTIGPQVDANPGSIWAVGNEPDRHGQDDQTPAQYAVFYHDVYAFLKQRDPTSRVMAAAIVQATPIRLRYLSMVLAEYQQRYGTAMPVDIWSMHGFILPESCSWGAGLPPGLEAFASEAVPCPATLAEHGNIETFKTRVRAFRQWMKDNGYRNQPLIISEYGILLSKYHGFPYATVRSYMLASFDFLLNTTDSQTGMPGDGNRLVQEFSWFSLNFYEYNLNTGQGLNGNLFDHDSKQIKPLGSDYETYAKGIRVAVTDLKVLETTAQPAPASANSPVLLRSRYVNQGGVAAQNVTVRFWLGDPRSGGQLLGTSSAVSQALAGCHPIYQAELSWTPTTNGNYTIFTDFQATNLAAESTLTNNYGSLTLTVGNGTSATATPTPSATTTATPLATSTATAVATQTPTATNSPTPTATQTVPPGSTATATPSPTMTPNPAATATPTATVTKSVTPSSTATATSSPTTTPSPAATATQTGLPIITATATGVESTPTATTTATATPTATLTPEALMVGAMIQPSTGGSLNLNDGTHQFSVMIPAGAVDQPTYFVLQEERGPAGTNNTFGFLGIAFTLDAYQNGVMVDNFVFMLPATVTVGYQDEDVAGANEDEVTLYYYVPSRSVWQPDGITVINRNPAQNQLTVEIAHLTQFGLFAAPTEVLLDQKLYLPLVVTD